MTQFAQASQGLKGRGLAAGKNEGSQSGQPSQTAKVFCLAVPEGKRLELFQRSQRTKSGRLVSVQTQDTKPDTLGQGRNVRDLIPIKVQGFELPHCGQGGEVRQPVVVQPKLAQIYSGSNRGEICDVLVGQSQA
ncbi:MAG: hypothetical protein CMO74_09795 [Verrucomicrobiales bacterium]|nr:hypothetical protein [Verrucomicrobiales bacterium]